MCDYIQLIGNLKNPLKTNTSKLDKIVLKETTLWWTSICYETVQSVLTLSFPPARGKG